jgi:2-polyprenyl-3-methyl-5-hydroxy-6-metoxy-1,4-benzoquinol methylase
MTGTERHVSSNGAGSGALGTSHEDVEEQDRHDGDPGPHRLLPAFDEGLLGGPDQALREHGDKIAKIPPNAHLVGAVADLHPGRALDAGCGHGSDTLWPAARGWQVTAVDPDRWELLVAEDRPRAAAGTGVDAVISARRRC